MVKKTKNNSCPSKKMVVNKGAWTAEEDEKLADYVKIHGDKKWRSLPAKAGLNRHGKSCRLRWLNYLRPGIKRGNISEEEEDLIIRLHNLLGNRWSLIAGRLPGRTDNEIKNHWNTHLSKKTLTINELNLKLNQKHETRSYCSSTSLTLGSNSPVAPEVDWPENVHQNNKSIGSQDSEIVSKPWSEVLKRNELLGDDFDVDKFFDFSSVPDLAECELDSDDQIGVHEHNLNDHGVYQGLLNAELQGTDGECLGQHIMFDQLDFGKLTRLLECD